LSRAKNNQTGESLVSHFHFRLREGFLILAFTFSAFLLLSLVSYNRADPSWSHYTTGVMVFHNSGGRVGAWLADFALYLCGYLAYTFPLLLSWAGWVYYRDRHRKNEAQAVRMSLLIMRIFGFIFVLGSLTGLASLLLKPAVLHMPFNSGGILGNVIGFWFLSIFNLMGTSLILMAIFLMGVTLFTGLSWFELFERLGAGVISCLHGIPDWFSNIHWGGFLNKLDELKAMFPKSDELETAPATAMMTPMVMDESVMGPAMESDSESQSNAMLPMLNVDDGALKRPPPRFAKFKILPKLSLLDAPKKEKTKKYSPQDLEVRSRLVEQRLLDFGVEAKVVGVYPGPVVTRYEIDLAAGTKVSKITGLAKDLARSLSVISVRVVEVIQGKSVIGIELPNEERDVVTLHEVIATRQFASSHAVLTLALGKDISGYPVVVDLAKMPHLLVAGTTGSGKSVCLNAMLLSLLYKSTPEQLRLILIDPKMLELAVYDGIPHLLTPVVTDMKDAATALRWCVGEMERRYRLMASLGVRNIAGYNEKLQQAQASGEVLMDPLSSISVELQTLPHIVVLADEFADMMVVVGKKVETLIARLAQKARAAGVHLIFATQRPSVDVITGLIKANIPTRIAFQVSSKIDSRTIIDQQGAENLLGNGDMLYLAPGTGVPVRIHGAFVSDDEVHRVVDYLKKHGETDYLNEVLDQTYSKDLSGYTEAALGEDGSIDDGEQDEFYDQAVEFIAKARRVSVSSIQRRFKIGYNRAARIVETMEQAGIVSQMEGAGMREVLVPPPAKTAEILSIFAPAFSAISSAKVVLPVPGDPHKIIECNLPSCNACHNGLPSPNRCDCPINSLICFGRIRIASGENEVFIMLIYCVKTSTPAGTVKLNKAGSNLEFS